MSNVWSSDSADGRIHYGHWPISSSPRYTYFLYDIRTERIIFADARKCPLLLAIRSDKVAGKPKSLYRSDFPSQYCIILYNAGPSGQNGIDLTFKSPMCFHNFHSTLHMSRRCCQQPVYLGQERLLAASNHARHPDSLRTSHYTTQ